MTDNFLLYTSKGKIKQKSDLNDILEKSIKNNSIHNITGILLYDGHYFLQVLEGSKEDINKLFQNILQNQLHCDVKLIIQGKLHRRNFPDWSMRLSYVEDNTIAEMHCYNMISNTINADNMDEGIFSILCKLLSNKFHNYQADIDGAFLKLSNREFEILQLHLNGNSTKEMADKLFISTKTVFRHMENIRDKLNCKSTKDITKTLFKSGHIRHFI